MSAQIPKDLRYDYEYAQRCGNDRLVPGYLAVQLIERIAELEAALRRFVSVATDAMPWSEHLDKAIEQGRAALAAAKEPKEKK